MHINNDVFTTSGARTSGIKEAVFITKNAQGKAVKGLNQITYLL